MVRNHRLVRGEFLITGMTAKSAGLNGLFRELPTKNGKVGEIQSVGRDITENKLMEKALQESEKNYRE